VYGVLELKLESEVILMFWKKRKIIFIDSKEWMKRVRFTDKFNWQQRVRREHLPSDI